MMDKGTRLSVLVYDYYETRITFGYYKYGEILPSIPQICALFHLGWPTVRAALARLEKEGLIRMEERKAAVVSFQADPSRFHENAARYYVPRKEGIHDFEHSGALLFRPLWEEGMRRWIDNKEACLKKEMSSNTQCAMPMLVENYIIMLSLLDNGLILNLYWEGIRYIRFLYLLPVSRVKENEAKEKWSIITDANGIDILNQELTASFKKLKDELMDFIDETMMRYELEGMEPIPFSWDIYRQRPQCLYTMISQIIREIMSGVYPIGSYLPSLPNMAKIYDVSLTTVRRTLSVLANLGVTRSYHGKGTQVYMNPQKIDFGKTEIREGLRLYRESLQLLALTIRGVSLYTLQNVTEEERLELVRQLREYRENRRSYHCFEIFLSFIKQKCPLSMVRNCYGKVAEFVVWGYPFALLYLWGNDLDIEYSVRIEQMEEHLLMNRLEAFSEDWQALIKHEETWCLVFAKQAANLTL